MSSRSWFRAGAAAILSLALSTTISMAQDHERGHERHDRDDDDRGRGHDQDREHEHGNGRGHDRDREHGHGNGRGHDHDRYSDHDRDSARGWYRAHYSHLPPGLSRHDRLPPGLERRLVVSGYLTSDLRREMHPCPQDLEVMLPPPPPNYAHVVIGGHLVLMNRANFQIADVFQFTIN